MAGQIEIKRTPREIAEALLATKHAIEEKTLEAESKNVSWGQSGMALLRSPLIDSLYRDGARTMLVLAKLEGRMQVLNFLFGDDNEISKSITEDWKRMQEGLNP